MVKRPGTTALIPTKREARPGMYITHNVHGKVKLLAEPVPNELKVQLKAGEHGIIVYAEDCGPPFSSAVKVQKDTFEDAWMSELRGERAVWEAYDQLHITHYSPPAPSSKAAGKQKTSGFEVPRTVGRPLGSKDKQPRKSKVT